MTQKNYRWQQFKTNPELLQPLLIREQVVAGIRSFFKGEGFNEVETPLLVAHPGTEPYLEVFATRLQISDGRTLPGYMLTSPEYAMKKLLVAGMTKIFQVCKSFRNDEGISGFHNHEFTILEWYRANADYTDIMNDCENLIKTLSMSITGQDQTLVYQSRKFDLQKPWLKHTVAELFQQQVGVDEQQLLDRTALYEAALKKEYQVTPETSWDDLFTQLFMNEIDPLLASFDQPVFIYDYPLPQAALSKPCANKPGYAERFELYIGGIELANAFSELTDAKVQRERFESELALRKELGKTEYHLDEDFIAALEAGMPESGGVALGVDRLAMLLANVPSIQDVLYFPLETVFDLS